LLRAFGSALIAALLFTTSVSAQNPTPPDSVLRNTLAPDSAVADTGGISPRTAFIRSLVIPGWGQASVGSYVRGGVFFGLQTSSAYMLLRTIGRVNQAKELEGRRRGLVFDSLRATPEFAEDSTGIGAAVDENELVRDASGLVNARRQQRQDWIAYLLVFTLASGVDALVAAHLADFPERIEVEPVGDGRVRFGLRFPTSLGGR